MFKIALVVFRESLEIAMLLGIILAITKRIEKSRLYIITGIMAGTTLVAFFSFFTRSVSLSLGGMGDEVFTSCIMFLTTGLISWTIIWMQSYGEMIKQNPGTLSDKINGSNVIYIMLILVVTSFVLEEGVAMVILIYSISLVETINSNSYILGVIIGMVSGVILGITIYLGLIKLSNQQYILRISSILLMLIAAGFAAEAAGIMASAGIVTILTERVWDSSWIITDRSVLGTLLHRTTGYIARPNELQIICYVCTIVIINILTYINAKYRKL